MYIEKKLNPLVLDVLAIYSKNEKQISVSELNNIIISATFGNIDIVRNYTGEPIGYILYALVSSATLRSIAICEGRIMYPYEWKSGKLPYIVDIGLLSSQATSARKQLIKIKRSKKLVIYWKDSKLILVHRLKKIAR